jgi:hypothetical protein
MISTERVKLQEFFDNHRLPTRPKRPTTFMDIMGYPHYENVLSNLYAFFFDLGGKHGLEDLFFKSLIQCYNQNIRDEPNIILESFTDLKIDREYSVDGKSIDILLRSNELAVIIENKVYHYLANDLAAYRKTIEAKEKERTIVIGIVMTLRKLNVRPSSNFVNVTHKVFLEKVLANLGGYLMSNETKYLILLKELNQNMINLTQNFMERGDLELYFRNVDHIKRAKRLRSGAINYIKDEIERAGTKIKNEDIKYLKMKTLRKGSSQEKRLRWFESEKCPNKMNLTIVFEKLFSGRLMVIDKRPI